MIDIHMHLIPGVDDGAEDMEMALVMMIRAKQQGISQIIATPHSEVFRYSKEGGKIIFKRLVDAAAKVCPDMKLYLGCEVYCETGIMDEVLEALDSGIPDYERNKMCADGILSVGLSGKYRSLCGNAGESRIQAHHCPHGAV